MIALDSVLAICTTADRTAARSCYIVATEIAKRSFYRGA
jgi:hypothetical protein